MLDVLIKNGRVVDGTGNTWYRSDIAIQGDEIVDIAVNLDLQARKVIDAAEDIVAPGFIDTHSHSDLMLLVEPEAKQKIMMGVTTELLGQDGLSTAPVKSEDVDYLRKRLSGLLGKPDVSWDWRTPKDYLDALERAKPATNLAWLVPHGQVRVTAKGHDANPPTLEELEKMKSLVKAAMEDGAFGISSGLIYPPCSFAKMEELVELCRVAAQYGGIFVVHMRNESESLLQAVAEVLEISRQSGAPLHVSHLKAAGKKNWGKIRDVLAMFDEARSRGQDVTFDQYPYVAGSTMLDAVIPPWAHEGGVDKFLTRIADRDVRDRIRKDISGDSAGWENWVGSCGWNGVIVTAVKSQKNKGLEGKSVAQICEELGKDPVDAVCDLLIEEDTAVSMAIFWGTEEDVATAMKHPLQMVATDGLLGGKPHPRVYGTYPRVLGKYVREDKVLTLPEAVRKMTSLPAQRLGLKDRGVIRPGMKADITIFDEARVIDKATYVNPHQFPEGIRYVLVNGQITVDRGRYRPVRAGRVLRKGLKCLRKRRRNGCLGTRRGVRGGRSRGP